MNFSPRNIQTQPLSSYELCDFGVNEQEARSLSQQIAEALSLPGPAAQWMRLAAEVLTPSHPFALHQWLFDCIHLDYDNSKGPAPLWSPSAQVIANANVTQFGSDLGHSGYAQLFTWAKQNRVDFWKAAIESLGVRFASEPKTILGDQQWLPDAQLNIADSCFQANEEKIAVVTRNEAGETRKISYGEMNGLVNRVAGGLRESGLQPGERVALMSPMTVEAVAAFLGTIRAGCVPVAIAESFAPKEIAVRLRLGSVKAIFLNDVICRGGKQLPCLEKFLQLGTDVLAIVFPSGSASKDQAAKNVVGWDKFISADSTFESVVRSANSESTILFSSGTTGEPKAIPWTQLTPLKCAIDGKFHQNIHKDSVVAWPTSLGWMMGPWLVYAGLLNRATIALFDGAPNTRVFCEFVQDAKVTMLGVIPSLVRAWKERGMTDGIDWTGIESFSSTGECSNSDDMMFLMSRAGYRPVIEYCGGTEIGGGYLTSTVVQPNAPSCFSTPALGIDLVLEDEEGELWSTDVSNESPVQGEVFLLGPSIGLSQTLLNADHDAVYFAETPPVAAGNQRLRRHGDSLVRFPNGYYQVSGRVDDAMNLGGIKVSAVEIERCLNQLDRVHETAAVALSNENGPAQLVVFAVTTDKDLDIETLRVDMQRLVSKQLNPLFRIARVELIDELPRTASNKVMRRKLRAK